LTMSAAPATGVNFYVLHMLEQSKVQSSPDGSIGTAKLIYPLTTFSSTGIDDNATSTAMTLDSNGNLLVGTTNVLPAINNVEGIALSAGSYGGRLEVSRDNSEAVSINRKTSDGSLMSFKKDGTTVGDIGTSTSYSGQMVINASSSNLIINANGSNYAFDSNQFYPLTAGRSLGLPGNQFNNLYLSGGVYVGGTTSANYLDDFEEGTATVTLNGSSGTPVPRLQTTAYYTKIGSLVHVHFEFNNVNTTSYSGQISIFGLPFAASSPSGTVTRQVSGDVQTYNMGSFTANQSGGLFFRINEGGTEVYLWSGRSANTWEAVTHSAGSSRYLIGGIIYKTDS